MTDRVDLDDEAPYDVEDERTFEERIRDACGGRED